MEQVAIDLGAGADNITINDVTGTDLKQVTVDLGADDQAADTVSINRPTATRSRPPTKTAWSRCRVWPAT